MKEYQALKEEMDQLIGRINGRFSKINWSPIRYIYGKFVKLFYTTRYKLALNEIMLIMVAGCISQEQLAAFYRDASVALVTPLRVSISLFI